MHEISVMQNILNKVKEIALENKADKVKKIAIQIGQMTCIDAENLLFVFEVMKKGSIAEEAEMVVSKLPVKAKCQDCGNEFAVENLIFLCDNCGSKKAKIIQGEEIILEKMEIE